MSDLYAVMGNPINHSKSPQIHSAFAEQTEQNLIYSAIQVPLDSFVAEVDNFFKNGRGLNITVPFKEQAWQYADSYSSRALRAGAVNTLIKKEDGTVHADNTDGVGMVRDIMVNNQTPMKNKRILVLGAGGAVRGILEPVLEEKPAQLVIANRTVEKAQALAEDFQGISEVTELSGCGFADLAELCKILPFDLIINGTSASLSGDLPPLPDSVIGAETVCYDMMYGAQTTVFNQWATGLNAAKTIDGLGMLVEQAAESFSLWREVRPDTQSVIDDIRAKLV